MNTATRQFVRDQAGNRCEYCRIPQGASYLSLQIEHIIARQHLGSDDLDNLALACSQCNAHKGPNLAAIDASSAATVPIYHPRRDQWPEHFEVRGAEIFGKTPTGRATVRLLQINTNARVAFRALLILTDSF